METSILDAGKEALTEVHEALLAYEQQEKDIQEANGQWQQLNKDAQSLEKKMQDNLAAVLKKRREELANAFDEEIEKDQTRLRATRNHREKAKSRGVRARIKEETSDLVQENKRINGSIKSLFKQKKVPFYCNTDIFYLMYLPKGKKERFLNLLVWILAAGVIPWVIVLVLPWPKWAEILLWIGIVVVEVAVYVGIRMCTKDKHHGVLTEMRGQRDAIRANADTIRAIKQRIHKDPDESHYGLGSFDDEIVTLENSIEQAGEKKKAALEEFESNTRPVIVAEITEQYKPGIQETKNQAVQMGNAITQMQQKSKQMRQELMTHYGNYVGNEFMNSLKTETLISIMESGRAATVGEAKQIYQQTSGK
jgi:hypothetical protein